MKRYRLRLSAENRSLLFIKAIDLLLVVVGVTIAFQLNNLKESSDEKSLERFYLEGIVADIDKDINSFNHILSELRADSVLTNRCLSRYGSGTVSWDALSLAVVNILSFETFNYRNDNTYTTLMNSHGLSIVDNQDARNLISEYYKSYKSIDRFEYVYTEFLLNDFHPYFAPYVDYATQKINDTITFNDAQTNNNLLMAGGQINDGIEKYKFALVKAFALRKMLAKV